MSRILDIPITARDEVPEPFEALTVQISLHEEDVIRSIWLGIKHEALATQSEGKIQFWKVPALRPPRNPPRMRPNQRRRRRRH